MKRALIRSALLVAAVGTFLALSAATSSASDDSQAPAPSQISATSQASASSQGSAAARAPAGQGERQPELQEPQQAAPRPAIEDRVLRTAAQGAGASDLVDAADGTVQRTTDQASGVLSTDRPPDPTDFADLTDPLRETVEDRLADGLPSPEQADLSTLAGDGVDPGTRPALDRARPVRGDVPRLNQLVAAPGGSPCRSALQPDGTPATDAGASDSDAVAGTPGPEASVPMRSGHGDALAAPPASSSGGADVAAAGRLADDAVARTSGFLLASRSEVVLLADAAGQPGFSPD